MDYVRIAPTSFVSMVILSYGQTVNRKSVTFLQTVFLNALEKYFVLAHLLKIKTI